MITHHCVALLHVSGNTVCNIKADNALFGDPCSGTDKYLQVFYDCV